MPKVGQVFTVTGVVDQLCTCCGTHGFYRFAEYPPALVFACHMFKPVEKKKGTEAGFSMLLDAAKKVEQPAPQKQKEIVDQLAVVSQLILEGDALLRRMRANGKFWR